MYNKDLTEDFRLRLNARDMNFLRQTADERCCSISEVVRSIIGDYRRSIELTETLKNAIALVNQKKEAELSDGDTKTNLDDIV